MFRYVVELRRIRRTVKTGIARGGTGPRIAPAIPEVLPDLNQGYCLGVIWSFFAGASVGSLPVVAAVSAA